MQLLYFKSSSVQKDFVAITQWHFRNLHWLPVAFVTCVGVFLQVWAAASEAKHQPPSNFLWKEQNRFRTSPDCTTILCKPNGEVSVWCLTRTFNPVEGILCDPLALIDFSILKSVNRNSTKCHNTSGISAVSKCQRVTRLANNFDFLYFWKATPKYRLYL